MCSMQHSSTTRQPKKKKTDKIAKRESMHSLMCVSAYYLFSAAVPILRRCEFDVVVGWVTMSRHRMYIAMAMHRCSTTYSHFLLLFIYFAVSYGLKVSSIPCDVCVKIVKPSNFVDWASTRCFHFSYRLHSHSSLHPHFVHIFIFIVRLAGWLTGYSISEILCLPLLAISYISVDYFWHHPRQHLSSVRNGIR